MEYTRSPIEYDAVQRSPVTSGVKNRTDYQQQMRNADISYCLTASCLLEVNHSNFINYNIFTSCSRKYYVIKYQLFFLLQKIKLIMIIKWALYIHVSYCLWYYNKKIMSPINNVCILIGH